MNTVDFGLFVYDDSQHQHTPKKKMYNRGRIITDEECNELNKWATKLYENGNLEAMSNGRYELRNNPKNTIPIMFEIKKRIEEKEKLTLFKKESVINDFLAVIPKNGFIHKHTDPNDFENKLFHIRFNVFITVPSNNSSNTYYNGIVVDTLPCCYVLCRSGIDDHWSDPNTSDTPRISLSFGYLLPAEKIDDLTKDVSIGTYTKYYPLAIQNIERLSLTLTNISEPIEIEERGEKGSCIYTTSRVMSDLQCAFIIKYIENNSSIWQNRQLDYQNNVECNYIMLNKSNSDYDIIDPYIFSTVGEILKKFKEFCPTFKGANDTGYTLRKIFGGTKQHCDGIHSVAGGFKNFVRCLSLIIVLNDDYDGGIFSFPNQGLKFRVQKGQALFFPPYWTHPHSVTSVGNGQSRYTINTWILEKFID